MILKHSLSLNYVCLQYLYVSLCNSLHFNENWFTEEAFTDFKFSLIYSKIFPIYFIIMLLFNIWSISIDFNC